MEEMKLKMNVPPVLGVPCNTADILLGEADGDAVLLYLYVLRNGGLVDCERAAKDLRRSDRDIGKAADVLKRLGLLSSAAGQNGQKKVAPDWELPEYTAADVARRNAEDGRFHDLTQEVQLKLGRVLTSDDLKKLLGIYDYLAMPAEVILMLIQYCKEYSEARFGKEKRVGFGFIEKEAYAWVDREIMTLERAEQWLHEYEERRTLLAQMQRTVGIRDRQLTKTERAYLENWISMGFPPESVAIAADRTITNTGGLKWKYMDSIIQSWHEKGLHTPEEIEKGDKKSGRSAKRGSTAATARADQRTIDELDRLIEEMENN